ncbi:sialate O-acetylesterase [Rhodopirellula sallentina]|uniref:Sialic acid-specific 9-O-acetylesterase n=1 Tax=Rhodopirellula sallentina SM41 TaxID=1263870 RepID=M5TT03_9BACT|nr:sialate O-acetylesterase [Rhodopirellula sallentina]EMI52285.1 sialic acid-specific 9-O-acetylesterase [Rhodopirellula sallentina SM41]
MKFKRMRIPLVTIAFVVMLSPTTAFAELTLASVFTDNAVLQRDMPVPVWGNADPAAKVVVEFAGQQKTATADETGKWRLELDALPASSDPEVLRVTSSDKSDTVSIANVVVGEVWICSGQSNMQMGIPQIPAIKKLMTQPQKLRSFLVDQTVSFSEQKSCSGTWREKHPDSAVAAAFAYFLEQSSGVPVGIIQTSWGSSSIEGWMPRDMTEELPHFRDIMQKFDADTEKRERIKAILEGREEWNRRADIFLRTQPNVIYNAMMHPLVPYACRGIVWYQGESNTGSLSSMQVYAETLKRWIQRYRREWNRDDLHFQIVMLPGFGKTVKGSPNTDPERPDARSWAWMRESQLSVLQLPHTSVANTIDLGMLKNIHPTDKLPIGKRLALLAAHDTLGQDILARGPVMKNVEREDNHLVVHFDHSDGLTTKDGNAPRAFWISDDSGQWVEADATIRGETVVLRSPEVKNPQYVRYAFAGKPKVNLVNQADLPAYPFRSDSFQP